MDSASTLLCCGWALLHALLLMAGVVALLSHDLRRLTGPLILVLLGAVGLLAACFMAKCMKEQSSLALGLSPGAQALVGMGHAMVVLVLVRLLSFKHFGGSFVNFDFGKKYSPSDGWTEEHLACTFSLNSCIHATQGFFTVFVYPEVRKLLSDALPLTMLMRFAAVEVAVYPLYSCLKRLHKSSHYFAFTSFFSTTFEWGIGLMFGNACGIAASMYGRCAVEPDTRDASENWSAAWLVDACVLALVFLIAAVQTVRTLMVVSDPSSSSEQGHAGYGSVDK